jgi:hypothetical protein
MDLVYISIRIWTCTSGYIFYRTYGWPNWPEAFVVMEYNSYVHFIYSMDHLMLFLSQSGWEITCQLLLYKHMCSPIAQWYIPLLCWTWKPSENKSTLTIAKLPGQTFSLCCNKQLINSKLFFFILYLLILSLGILTLIFYINDLLVYVCIFSFINHPVAVRKAKKYQISYRGDQSKYDNNLILKTDTQYMYDL